MSEKIAVKDGVARQYLKDINTVLEDAIDKKIYKEEYFLKYPLLYTYNKRENGCSAGSAIRRLPITKVAKFENMYKGRNAADILEYPELSITRGSYYNELNIKNLFKSPLMVRGKENLEDVP